MPKERASDKLVYITSRPIPSREANGVHVMKMCQAFANIGYEVTLIAPDAGKQEADSISSADVFSHYGVEERFEIIRLQQPSARGGAALYGLKAAVTAWRLRPRIVHSRSLSAAFFASVFRQRTDLELHQPIKGTSALSDFMFRVFSTGKTPGSIVTITHALKQDYLRQHPGMTKLVIVAPDGADPVPDGSLPVVFPNKGNRLQIGYVGHLYPGKGMEVIWHLAQKCPSADFHVVGGMEADRRAWQEKSTGIDNLFFHGHVSPREAVRHMLGFDIALLPNQKDVYLGADNRKANIGSWTSPLKLFEYFAAGVPLIASDLPVLKEILVHGVNAMLCPPQDFQMWLDTIRQLEKDPHLAETIAATARHQLETEYSWLARARHLAEYHQQGLQTQSDV